jgi:nucleoside-diphosphate-sugar epimerase
MPGPVNKHRAFVVGCGYVGRRLALALKPRYQVLALVSSPSSLKRLRREGIDGVVVDLDKARAGDLSPAWLKQTVVFYLAPPPATGESDTRLDHFFQLATTKPNAFIYMSTTGVYGDTEGAIVDEATPLNPLTERARRRLSAEHMTRVWCTENEVRRVVLRVPGIYGPYRLPLERLRRGEPVIRASEAGISNHMHVDDLVQVCVAAANDAEVRGIFNVSDGNAHTTTEYFELVAQLAGLPPPTQIPLDEARLTLSAERMSFLDESRRVSNRRLLQELRVKLKYADLAAGIRASLEEEAASRR